MSVRSNPVASNSQPAVSSVQTVVALHRGDDDGSRENDPELDAQQSGRRVGRRTNGTEEQRGGGYD